MISENRIRQIVKESIKHVLNESSDTRKLYHCVNPYMPLQDAIHSVVNNGLLVHDNGERGSGIWFNVGEPFYPDFRGMIVSIMATPENIERFRIVDDYSQMFARESIPFEFLTVEQIPFCSFNGNIMTSFEFINKNRDTLGDFIDILNKSTYPNIVVFKDVVDRFSGQILDWNKLTNPNVKLMNIL